MRVAHYLPYLLGHDTGSGNAGRGWCAALVDRGVEVVAITDRSVNDRPPPDGVSTVRVAHSLAGPLRIPMATGDAFDGADVVVVHGGWVLGNIVIGRACQNARIPFVITTHGAYAPEVWRRRKAAKLAWASLIERRHVASAAAIHVFFPEEGSTVVRSMQARPAMLVAPNGITPPEGVIWDGGSGGYLLWLGRFDVETKGLDLLIRAIAYIPRSQRLALRLHGPDWRGGKSRLQSLVHEVGVQSSVDIMDPAYGDEKWELIRKARGFVYPSRWDACPVAVSEAAAVGVPTLVGPYPLGSLLRAKHAAVQVDSNVSSLARGLGELISPDAGELGWRASQVAKEALSWEAVSRSWLNQVTALLENR